MLYANQITEFLNWLYQSVNHNFFVLIQHIYRKVEILGWVRSKCAWPCSCLACGNINISEERINLRLAILTINLAIICQAISKFLWDKGVFWWLEGRSEIEDCSKVNTFFSIWVFFHEHSRVIGLQGKKDGIF